MSSYLANPLEFPITHPEGFPMLDGEPAFDAAKHLQIEMPDTIISLKEFGYTDEDISECPCDFGITNVFRILSDEGAQCMLEVARMLEPYVKSNARISRNVRGGAYQSKFLRDLCQSPELTEAVSKICGSPMLPHTIPHQLGHMNYNPKEVGENVDKWHVDTLRIDFVMFVTDPNSVVGGEFEYYLGTKEEVAELKKQGKPLDPAKIKAPVLPGPGYAVLQQGNMVVHRAKGLTEPGERITMVNGYVPRDVSFPDYTRFDQLYLVDPKHMAASEYMRHISWMGRELLDGQLKGFEFSEDRAKMADNFEQVAQMMAKAAEQLRKADEAKIEHFGDG
jgi:hypothetical protein